jgi:seryl-tRNA synthetase
MIDINLLRRDVDGVVAQLQRRKSPQPFLDVAGYTRLEAERKQIQTATEQLQARRNAASKQIGQLKGKGQDTSELMLEVSGIADELKTGAERLEVIQRELQLMLMSLPNCPAGRVPSGTTRHAKRDNGIKYGRRKIGSPRSKATVRML